MPVSGILNVVCHGTIAFLVRDDGWIELLIPEVDPVWDHDYQGGAWAGDLDSIAPGKDYHLAGVQPGDGRQTFDRTTMVWVGPATPLAGFRRKLVLPPPKRISGANYVPVSPAQTFVNPSDPRVACITRMNLLNVLSYDCADLDAVSLVAGPGDELQIATRIVTDGSVHAVNLHIFAEPSTFVPLQKAASAPAQKTPFNALVANLRGAEALEMKPPGGPGGFSSADIDPGLPIAGLPEPEKLALSQHARYRRYGMLHEFDRPFNCAGIGGGGGGGGAITHAVLLAPGVAPPAPPAPAPTKAFAILRNSAPRVLKQPRIVLVHWGSATCDSQVEDTVQKMIALDYIKSALHEYGVAPPQFVKSVANPLGSKAHIQDAHESPATTHGSAIAQGLNQMILDGRIENPGRDSNLLILVVAAPGAAADAPGVSGSHNYFYFEDAAAGRIPVPYAWALQGPAGGPPAPDSFTLVLSHELLEASTDPEPPYGWVFEGPEICDVAAGRRGVADGMVVSGYYSYRDGKFKTP